MDAQKRTKNVQNMGLYFCLDVVKVGVQYNANKS